MDGLSCIQTNIQHAVDIICYKQVRSLWQCYKQGGKARPERERDRSLSGRFWYQRCHSPFQLHVTSQIECEGMIACRDFSLMQRASKQMRWVAEPVTSEWFEAKLETVTEEPQAVPGSLLFRVISWWYSCDAPVIPGIYSGRSVVKCTGLLRCKP
jgi:hypothetical protein